MQTYDVQQIELGVPAARAFAAIADPSQLPRWTRAFAKADDRSAVMHTPAGDVTIGLATAAHAAAGTVDWRMRFPDGAEGWAHSRVVPLALDRCVYTFVLHAPPVPLEAIEGALDAQRATLAGELKELKRMLEGA